MKSKWFAWSLVLLGIIMLIALYTVAVPCPLEEGMKPMKCFWTHRAMKGLGYLIVALGGITYMQKTRSAIRSLSLVNILLSGYGIALVTFLIGTCKVDEMTCNVFFRPAMIVLMAMGIILSVVAIMAYKDSNEEL